MKSIPVILRLIFPILVLLTGACSATKSVPEGAYLYTGAEIDLGEDEQLATTRMLNDVQEVIRPAPNSRIMGMPLRLYLYQFFDNGKEKGLLPWARDQLGQAPVLYQPGLQERVEPVIANRLFNNGYFDGKVDSEIKLEDKKAKVIYHLDLAEPYRIDSFCNSITHPLLKSALDSLPASRVLKSGNQYNLDDLEAEADRVAEYLKRKGFYYFHKDYLKFQVDSTDEQRQVQLRMVLRDDVPPEDLQIMRIGGVKVFPDVDGRPVQAYDRVENKGLSFYYGYTPHRFRVKPLSENILFRPGDRYNVDYHFNTLKRLVNLNTFSFVNVQYERRNLSDSIDMLVTLSPRRSQNITGSVGLSYKNSQYIGPEIELTYTNRNLFKGSENLRFRVYTSLNFPLKSGVGNFFEKSGAEGTLTLPGLRIPFYKEKNFRELRRATSKFDLLYQRERVSLSLASTAPLLEYTDAFPEIEQELAQDSSYAPFIGISSFEFTFGYQWQRKPQVSHELNPLGLGMQFGTFQSKELKSYITTILILSDLIKAIQNGDLTEEELEDLPGILEDLSQGNLNEELDKIFGTTVANLLQFEDMLYWNPSYTFSFDSREEKVKRDNYFYRGRLSLTGNILLADPNFQFFDKKSFQSYFSQVENDFRYYRIFPRKKHTLATRLVVDVSYPFGAELFLPFLNLFSVAGPNSVRAYSLRELGPGTLQLNEEGSALTLFAGKGDIHLESSIEYRHKFTSIFELAAFADAGNVWVLRSNSEAANFRFGRFLRELGFGVGLGFRLNINPLVLRLDLAMPLTKPWLPEGQRWVGNQIDLFYGGWRKENLQFNLSFGYPF